ncbi:hypothetical protein FA15DRAFT_431163 [Coprinopsis marcescibilis]|uniref:Thioesterase/thiol ester dehydrase-isomerase n=1 Tax=Coprinopsis marcescibilis TaxID=230819 RepID=A0A5C3KVA0_COPMA|nr:hypothetical protein FA15DRAFT_431163 [Coprinopsis marcescibilis]
MTKHRKIELEEQWLDTIPNVGQNPFEFKNVYRTTATLDECDWNMHLSNSSYAKILDSSRFETAVQLWPLFFRSGGTLALGATHFQFIREIPPLTNFEIRTYVGTWDKKWLYLVSKYVSKPKRRVPDKAKPLSPPDSTTGTPPPTRSILTESDGAIVHTIAIAHLCFKANRITVPPAFVLATNGFSTFPYTSPTPYSARNPPPHWQKVKNIASLKHGGSMRKFFKFMREGWKEVPEKERWWETALGGEVETRRVLALAELEPLQKGLDAALHVG